MKPGNLTLHVSLTALALCLDAPGAFAQSRDSVELAAVRTDPTIPSSPTFERLTVAVSRMTNPLARLSPDGARLAVVILGQPWVVDAVSGEAAPLAEAETDPVAVVDAAWSPDGRRLALSLWDRPGAVRVRVYDVGGRTFEALSPTFVMTSLRWAPRGDTLLGLIRDTVGTWLMSVAVADGSTRRSAMPAGTRAFDVAPDQQRLIVAGPPPGDTAGGQIGLWLMDRRTSAHQPLLRDPAADEPTFHPTAERIVYRSGSGDDGVIRVLDLDGPGPSPVTVAADGWIDRDRPGWAHNGSAIAYAADGLVQVAGLESATRDTLVFRATHTVRRWEGLRRPTLQPPQSPSVSASVTETALAPDASRLAFTAAGDLWVVDTAGTRPRRLTETPDREFSPHWSPDGRWIAYRIATLESQVGVRLLEPATGRTVALNVPGTAEISWSRDGRRLGFMDPAPGGVRAGYVFAESAAGMEAPAPVVLPGFRWHLTHLRGWSAAGDSLVIVTGRDAGPDMNGGSDFQWVAHVVDPVSGTSRLLDVPAAAIPRARWDPTLARAVYRHAGRAFIAELGGSEPARPLQHRSADGFSWSADGSVLAYVANDTIRLRDMVSASARSIPQRLQLPAMPRPPPTLIRNVRIFDGSGAATYGPRDVLLSEGRIERIGAPGSIPVPGDGSALDGTGRVLTPGLINTHVHLPPPSHSWNGLLSPAFPYHGTTTVRDLGTQNAWLRGEVERVRTSGIPAPNVVFSGGHVERELGWGREWKRQIDPGDSAGVRQALSALAASGADVAKIWLMDPTAFGIVPYAAHAVGLPVTSHYPYASAFAHGLEGMEHLFYYRWGDTPVRADLIGLLRANGTCVTPTLDMYDGDPERALDDDAAPMILTNTKRLHDAGVLIAAGTDARELDSRTDLQVRALHVAGLSRAAALRAAMLDAARCIFLDHEIGTVDVGKRADLLLLERDPAEDLRALDDIAFVILAGSVHARPQLLEMRR